MTLQQTWTFEETQYLIKHYNSFSIKELVNHYFYYFYVERSISSIRNKAFFLGLRRLPNKKRIV
jgi:hypothetical protein